MSLKWRRLFFYFYLAVFLLAAPAVVLYTMGYRFNFTTGRLVQTGALSVSSIPKAATVWLDDQKLDQSTPTVVNRFLPGTYHLRLAKDGYKPWEREVEIKSRQTTIVDNAVLFLDVAPELLKAIEAVEGAASDDGRRFAYATTVGSWIELWVMDVVSGEVTLEDRLSAVATNEANLVLRLDRAVAEPPEDEIYALRQVETGVELTSAIDGQILAILPAGNYTIESMRDDWILLRQASAERIILVDTRTDGPPILLNTIAEFYRWSDGQLLYSDGIELHRYDVKNSKDELLTRGSVLITDAIALPQGQTIMIVTAQGVTAVDFSDPASPVRTVIVEVGAIEEFWIDAKGQRGFFYGTVNETAGLYSIRLTR